jgi:hypothetical protein
MTIIVVVCCAEPEDGATMVSDDGEAESEKSVPG